MYPVVSSRDATTKVRGRPLPYTRHYLDDADIAAAVHVLRSDRITQGGTVARFEERLVEQTGARHAVAVSSGSAALELIAQGLPDLKGKAVIVPAITFAATANAFLHAGAEVVFADVDPSDGILTPETAHEALRRAREDGLTPAAVVVVGLAGKTPDLGTLAGLCAEEKVYLIEDAAHSFGGSYTHAERSYASASCCHTYAAALSFHPAKLITTGEGGAVITSDDDLAARTRLLRTHGILPQTVEEDDCNEPWFYDQEMLGHNYRLSDIQAAIGTSQLDKLDYCLQRRRDLARILTERLNRAPFRDPMILPKLTDGHAWHLYMVRFHERARRDAAYRYFRQQGIEVQVHYRPLYHFSLYGGQHKPLPGAERWYDTCLTLPLFPLMTSDDLDAVESTLEDFLRHPA